MRARAAPHFSFGQTPEGLDMMPWIKVDDMFPHDEVFLKAGA